MEIIVLVIYPMTYMGLCWLSAGKMFYDRLRQKHYWTEYEIWKGC